MFWSNSTNQCDIKSCLGYQVNNLSVESQYQKRFKNNLNPLSPLSAKRKQQDDTVLSSLAEKRSLKKYTSPKRNPETSSITSSFPDSASNTHIKIYSSPQRKPHHQNPTNGVIYIQPQPLLQHDNAQALDKQKQKKSHHKNREAVLNRGNSITQRTFDSNLKLSAVSFMSPQKIHPHEQHERIFERKQPTTTVGWQNSHLQYIVSPNNNSSYRNNSIVNNIQSKNRFVKSPIKFTYISPPKQTFQVSPTIINTKNNNKINLQNVKQSYTFYSQHIGNIYGNNNLVANQQQFPTIKQQNQYYQQSGTAIQSKRHLAHNNPQHQQPPLHSLHKPQTTPNPAPLDTTTNKTLKRQQILKQINEVLHSEKEFELKSFNRESFTLSNCEDDDDQTSVIIPNNNNSHVEIDMMYEGLLTPTELTINDEIKKIENKKLQLQEQSSVDNNVALHNCSLSPSEEYCYYRRPKHLPSIAFRVIQNKLRAHNYQLSQLQYSQKLISNSIHYQKQPHQNNQNNQDNNNNKFQQHHYNNQIESRWKKLYEQNNENNILEKQVHFPFNIRVEECKSQWLTDGDKNVSKEQDSSLVDKLTGEKATDKVMQDDKLDIDSASLTPIPTPIAHTDHQCPPRKQLQKKFKTLVNRKVTIHSIVEQDFYPQFYPQQIAGDQSHTHGNEHVMENIFKLNQHMMGRFSKSIPTSYENIERGGNQSTVIDKVTFRGSE